MILLHIDRSMLCWQSQPALQDWKWPLHAHSAAWQHDKQPSSVMHTKGQQAKHLHQSCALGRQVAMPLAFIKVSTGVHSRTQYKGVTTTAGNLLENLQHVPLASCLCGITVQSRLRPPRIDTQACTQPNQQLCKHKTTPHSLPQTHDIPLALLLQDCWAYLASASHERWIHPRDPRERHTRLDCPLGTQPNAHAHT
jgi:hypothetical protein